MKKVLTLFLLISVSFISYGQFNSDSIVIESITMSKTYWTVYYADSVPKRINGKEYSGIDTSHFLYNGEKLLAIEIFKNGFKVEVKTFYDNGNPERYFQFKNGKRNSISRGWYKSGKIMFNDKIGEKNISTHIMFYENGNPKYVSDEESGVSMGFYENGRVEGLTKYIDDSVMCGNKKGYEETRWYEDGGLMLKQINNCGKQSYKLYYNDTTVFSDETIIDMPLFHVGKYTKWYKDRTLMIEGQYKDGVTQSEANIKTGVWKYYNENGGLEKEEYYENNKLIKAKEYRKPKKIKESEK